MRSRSPSATASTMAAADDRRDAIDDGLSTSAPRHPLGRRFSSSPPPASSTAASAAATTSPSSGGAWSSRRTRPWRSTPTARSPRRRRRPSIVLRQALTVFVLRRPDGLPQRPLLGCQIHGRCEAEGRASNHAPADRRSVPSAPEARRRRAGQLPCGRSKCRRHFGRGDAAGGGQAVSRRRNPPRQVAEACGIRRYSALLTSPPMERACPDPDPSPSDSEAGEG